MNRERNIQCLLMALVERTTEYLNDHELGGTPYKLYDWKFTSSNSVDSSRSVLVDSHCAVVENGSNKLELVVSDSSYYVAVDLSGYKGGRTYKTDVPIEQAIEFMDNTNVQYKFMRVRKNVLGDTLNLADEAREATIKTRCPRQYVLVDTVHGKIYRIKDKDHRSHGWQQIRTDTPAGDNFKQAAIHVLESTS